MDFVLESFQAGERILAGRSDADRKALGQYLTPPIVARYLARQLNPLRDGDHILDPAMGSGVLACAVMERAIESQTAGAKPLSLWLDGYEIDPQLAQAARENLILAQAQAAEHHIELHTSVTEGDFVLSHTSPGPLFPLANAMAYDHIVANPPYLKLNRHDPRVQAMPAQSNGYTNIYTLFMALALKLLAPTGRASFIIPRSFCSGSYFSAFREHFIQQAEPVAVHLFQARDRLFAHGNVLQENIVFTFRRRPPGPHPFRVAISISHSAKDLEQDSPGQRVDSALFLGRLNGSLFFRLPTGALDKELVQTIDAWSGTLEAYGLGVSTGPVVAFRARDYLTDASAVSEGRAVPLLWMQNVCAQEVVWPVSKRNKPQGILASAGEKLLVPNQNYVLLRRFSAKEERRRLIVAPLLAEQFTTDTHIGLENHLNYVYRRQGELTKEEAIGLSTLLNNALIDRYFRILNGNTQVNATELRALPLPPLEVIRQLGQTMARTEGSPDLDDLAFNVLREAECLPADFPTLKETRIRRYG